MIRTRITEMLGVKYPIVQAPMGWIARAQLASAVSNAGALGIICPMVNSAAEAAEVLRFVLAAYESSAAGGIGVNPSALTP